MKKYVCSIIALMVVVISNAQTEQGDWLVGGNFRLNTADKNTEIAFNPNAGYFFAENFALGANLSLNSSKSGNNKFTSFGIGPFARYYFTTQNETIRPIVHGSFNYLSTKNKIGNISSSTNTGTNFFIGGGAAAFISNSVSIDALMGYDRTKYKNFDGSGGFAFNIGFQVYINKGLMEKVTKKK